MRLSVLLAAFFFIPLASAQSEADVDSRDFVVTALGDTLRGDVEIKDPFLGCLHVLVDGERRDIQTLREITLDGETMAVVDGRSLATLQQDGRVRFYSRTTTTGPMMTPGPNGTMMMTGGSSNEVGYVQVGQGPIQRATVPNLRTALHDNPESIGHLDRYRSLGYAQYGVTAVSVGLFLGGGYQMYQAEQNGEEISLNPLVVIGAAGATIGQLVFPGLRNAARRRAIDSYNR